MGILEPATVSLPLSGGLAQDVDERLIQPGRWARLENLVVNKTGALEKRYGFQEVEATSDTGSIERSAHVADFYGEPSIFSDPTAAMPRVYQRDGVDFRDRGVVCPASLLFKSAVHRSGRSAIYPSICRVPGVNSTEALIAVWLSQKASSPAAGDTVFYKLIDPPTGLARVSETELTGTNETPISTCAIGGEMFVAQRSGTTVVIKAINGSGAQRTVVTVAAAGASTLPFDICPYSASHFVLSFYDGANITVSIRAASNGAVTATQTTASAAITRMAVAKSATTVYVFTSDGVGNNPGRIFSTTGPTNLGASAFQSAPSLVGTTAIAIAVVADAAGDFFLLVQGGIGFVGIHGTWVRAGVGELLKRVYLPWCNLSTRPALLRGKLWGSVSATAGVITSPDQQIGALVCWDDNPGDLTTRRPPALCGVYARYQDGSPTSSILPPLAVDASDDVDVLAGIVTATAGANRFALDLYRFTANPYVAGARQSCPVAGARAYAGAYAGHFDGFSFVEAGFLNEPTIDLVVAGAGGTGQVAAGTYQHTAVYECRDDRGNLHRSRPSRPVQTVVGVANSSFTVTVRTTGITRRLGTGARDVRIHIFRTIAGPGADFYRITSESSALVNDPSVSTLNFTDTSSDAAVQGFGVGFLYSPPELEALVPPAPVCVLAHKGRAWVASPEQPRQVFYSKPLVEGLAPEFNDALAVSLPQANSRVTALAPLDEITVAYTETQIFGIGGEGRASNGLGGDYSVFAISSDVGCVNPSSVAATSAGVFFQSKRGICLLGRDHAVRYVGGPVEASLAAFPIIRGVEVDQKRGRVLWLCIASELAGSEHVILCFDIDRGIWTTWSVNGSSFGGQALLSGHCFSADRHWLSVGEQLIGAESGFRDFSLYVPTTIETPWVSVASLVGHQRTRKFGLQATRYDVCNLGVKVRVDLNPTDVQTFSFNLSSTTTVLDPSRPRMLGTIAVQKHSAIKLIFTETESADDVGNPNPSAGRGLSYAAIALAMAGKRGFAKVAAGNKR